MAVEYITEGATGFGAANWSGSGFADTATLVIDEPIGHVTTDLDQSGLTTGIEYLDIRAGATKGKIGGDGNGSLIVDADNSADAYVRNRGNVELYLDAGGGSGVINNLDLGGRQRTWLTGSGTFTDVTIDGGSLNVAEGVVITNLYGLIDPDSGSVGGGTIEYASTGATAIEINGGNWVVKRGFTSLEINAGTVTIDAEQGTLTTLTQNGGRVIAKAGAPATYNGKGGVLDFSQARRSMTYGSSTLNLRGTKVVRASSVANVNSTIGVPGGWPWQPA